MSGLVGSATRYELSEHEGDLRPHPQGAYVTYEEYSAMLFHSTLLADEVIQLKALLGHISDIAREPLND